VGDFTGRTDDVSGAAIITRGAGVSSGWVEAPVGTLRTGNSRRDRDMRSVVEADRYPTVRFDAKSVTAPAAFGPGETAAVLHGTFSLHGVTRAVDVAVTVSRITDSVRVVGGFPLDVSAHGVVALRRMFGVLRVNAVVDVRLTLLFLITNTHIIPPGDIQP
jgi:polyisoprenoid-binding protein YceI